MRTLPLLLAAGWLLAGCESASIKLSDDTGNPADTDADADTDTDADTDADTDTDTDTDTDVEPVMVPDYSVYEATRNFYFDYEGYECDETVTDSGELLDESDDIWGELADLCGDCEYFYEVTPSQDSVCEYIGLGTTYRGVVLGDGEAELYFFRESGGGWGGGDGYEEYASDTRADLSDDGAVLDYAYEYEQYITIEVTGTVTWPLIEQE